MNMIKLFSDLWFEKFKESINKNEEYEKYASDWEGDIIINILGDENSYYVKKGTNILAQLKLYHGKCLELNIIKKLQYTRGIYILEGKATVWENILAGKTDIVTAVLKNEIKITGEINKLFKYMNAAREIVKSAQKINLKEG